MVKYAQIASLYPLEMDHVMSLRKISILSLFLSLLIFGASCASQSQSTRQADDAVEEREAAVESEEVVQEESSEEVNSQREAELQAKREDEARAAAEAELHAELEAQALDIMLDSGQIDEEETTIMGMLGEQDRSELNALLGGIDGGLDASIEGGLGALDSDSSRGVGGLGLRGSGTIEYGDESPIPTPVVVHGVPVVDGDLDEAIISRVLRQHRRQVQHCYEVELQRQTDREGEVTLRFVIGSTGAVASSEVAESSLESETMESCLQSRTRRWSFPAPGDGEEVSVEWSVQFSIAEDQ